ncbi:UvrD-helicase domain-containing protein [Luteimonas fraxinea]|uniref:UvrD-helicase domain-containing protein n=1 Tax=Luteimonas fraxinea TaxID=2901869 RepID=UPI001E2D4029|nr:UvrD-helicase domain-containing protein [Luteimonas fraxinea]MCD9125415.1 UvrD-helicase domain-containing protein [Luteimonas fraxinea]
MPIVLCEQRQRLLATEGHIVVRGGAGSGKTTIALAKACEELAANRLGITGKALFVSFARATVARVAEQATASLPRDQLARIEINTYHGFAWSILRSHAYLLGTRAGVSLLLPAQERSRLAGLTDEERVLEKRRLFEEEGLVAFDLFPTLLAELLDQLPVLSRAVGDAYPVIILDEFQDTSAEEWEMVLRLGRHSTLIALGDPKQRIYDFKGADPRRFDDFIEAFTPVVFDFASENNRSVGTDIPLFADALISGGYRPEPYAGVSVVRYGGRGLHPLKQLVLRTAGRYRRRPEWSVAVLVPSNKLAANVYDYMRREAHGLPRYAIDIAVSMEGPTLAAMLIALLLEPSSSRDDRGAQVLEAMALFEVGRKERAKATAIETSRKRRALAEKVRLRGEGAYGRGVGAGVRQLVSDVEALQLQGDPFSDWLAVRALLEGSARPELKAIATEARYMRLLRRGAQIEARLAEAWRNDGAYLNARELLRAALVEDQFSATSRAQQGVVVMTIHKAKGKEFDEVIVFEDQYNRYHYDRGPDSERSSRFNLHVATTRARTAVSVMTPAQDPCPLLPQG